MPQNLEMEGNHKYILEELGYDKGDVIEILGFKSCFQIKSRCIVGEESAVRLYNKFNGHWVAAGLWYRVVDNYHKKMGHSLLEEDIVNEIVDELEYYQNLMNDGKD